MAEIIEFNGNKKARVFKFISGKGGTGKSVIAANLAYIWAKQGKRVLIFDSDYTKGNLDVLYKKEPRKTTIDLLYENRQIYEIAESVQGGAKLVPSGLGVLQLTDLADEMQDSLDTILEAERRSYDVILIDSPSGIGSHLYHFSSFAVFVLVTAPEHTAVLDAFAAIKTLRQQKVDRFRVILNNVYEDSEIIYIRKLEAAVHDFGVKIDFLGMLPYDMMVRDSINEQRMIKEACPDSEFGYALEHIAEKMMKRY